MLLLTIILLTSCTKTMLVNDFKIKTIKNEKEISKKNNQIKDPVKGIDYVIGSEDKKNDSSENKNKTQIKDPVKGIDYVIGSEDEKNDSSEKKPITKTNSINFDNVNSYEEVVWGKKESYPNEESTINSTTSTMPSYMEEHLYGPSDNYESFFCG